jgi:integrase
VNVTRKGNRWVLDWRENRHRRRAHFTTERDARRALQQKLSQAQGQPPRPTNRQLQELTARFASTKAGNHDTHYGAVTRVLNLLCETVPANVSPATLQPQHLAEFRRALTRYSSNTRIYLETIVRDFLRQAWNTAQIHCPLSELFPRTKGLHTVRRQTLATPEQIAALLSAALPSVKPALTLVATLCREAGARISEACAARAGDWNTATREITIRSVKRHPHRTNPANPTLAAYLDALIPKAADPDALLLTLVNPRGLSLTTHRLHAHWNKARRKARLPRFTPHDLRRTWATEHAEFAPLPVLMELAGWNQPKTAIHYLMSQGREARQKAVARAWNARQAHTLEAPDAGETKPTARKERVN